METVRVIVGALMAVSSLILVIALGIAICSHNRDALIDRKPVSLRMGGSR